MGKDMAVVGVRPDTGVDGWLGCGEEEEEVKEEARLSAESLLMLCIVRRGV